ncbi:hypothetical protein AALP_AA5G279100 [Arabis alpina]|uniref:Fold protein n=1 Tax=Arabis alpina TaxID=50452 RepID=A0A087GZT9_ARAAL|nr:hypothetical protein AALP_AA5G279100 [Arabis alpina]
MSLEESLMMLTSFPLIEEDHDRYHQTRNSLSRLSICTSSVSDNDQEKTTKKKPNTSESFDGEEADVEVSDNGKENVPEWDSDKETPLFYSLPVNPSRRRRKLPVSGELDGKKCNLRRQRREKKKKGFNGVVDGGSDGLGLTVLTRAKGGDNPLRMGLEEVKACRDLGFDLEVPVPGPGRISVSTGSTFDTQTSSGNNSPIATWRISSPGDDPKEVKARLRVWAQAVALASSSSQV